MHTTNPHDAYSIIVTMADTLSAGCDSDFDAAFDDLEREFQELRLQLPSFEYRRQP